MSLRTMLISAVLVSGLAACDAKPTEVGPGAGGQNVVEKAPASRISVELPPSISASKQYRCADNSLAFVEFYSDGLSASVKTDPQDRSVRIVSPEAGKPMVAEGWSLKGGKDDAKITLQSPKHPKAMSCHV